MAILNIILVLFFRDFIQQTLTGSLKWAKPFSRCSGYSNGQRQKSLPSWKLHFSWIWGTQSSSKYIGKIDIMDISATEKTKAKEDYQGHRPRIVILKHVLESVNLEDTFKQRPEECRDANHRMLGASSFKQKHQKMPPVYPIVCSVLEDQQRGQCGQREESQEKRIGGKCRGLVWEVRRQWGKTGGKAGSGKMMRSV